MILTAAWNSIGFLFHTYRLAGQPGFSKRKNIAPAAGTALTCGPYAFEMPGLPMNILLHTIALEPARWLPRKVSHPLTNLLPLIAAAGFTQLEIFEPHLDENAPEIRASLARLGLQAVILSSYLNLNPAETQDGDLAANLEVLAERIDYFGFRKLRLFPGPRMSPNNADAAGVFTARLRKIMNRLPHTEVLLETHDGSLADDAATPVRIVEELALPNLGLLYQPTVFTAEAALAQFKLQKHLIRHVHLQNRNPDLSFTTLRDGVVPWQRILKELPTGVDATIEFVPAGICTVEEFDVQAALEQARGEADYLRNIA
jgi:sugar phosphate isomerase/epimerase